MSVFPKVFVSIKSARTLAADRTFLVNPDADAVVLAAVVLAATGAGPAATGAGPAAAGPAAAGPAAATLPVRAAGFRLRIKLKNPPPSWPEIDSGSSELIYYTTLLFSCSHSSLETQ